jgi:hypothetical protein
MSSDGRCVACIPGSGRRNMDYEQWSLHPHTFIPVFQYDPTQSRDTRKYRSAQLMMLKPLLQAAVACIASYGSRSGKAAGCGHVGWSVPLKNSGNTSSPYDRAEMWRYRCTIYSSVSMPVEAQKGWLVPAGKAGFRGGWGSPFAYMDTLPQR